MGTAKTTHVFGIGGLKTQALVYEAKKDLYRSYPLSEGQAFANISVDFKRSYIFFVSKTIATLTADVVEFNEGSYDSVQKGMNQLVEYKSDSIAAASHPFKTGQVVGLFERNSLITVRILSDVNTDKDKYIVEYTDPSNGSIQSVKPTKLYFLSNNNLITNAKFRIGDNVKTPSSGTSEVVAIGIENYILKNKYGIFKADPTFLQKE